MDHLIAGSRHGTNHISNYVLACAHCNGDEKLDKSWEEFLKCKADDASRLTRERRIREWIESAPTLDDRPNAVECQAIIDESLKSFDRAVRKMRKIKARE